jgi:hypothetical protein
LTTDASTASLRRVIKTALRPRQQNGVAYDGRWKNWFERKIDALSSFALTDRSTVSPIAWDILDMRYGRGIPLPDVARSKNMSTRQADRYINEALDALIAAMTPGQKANLFRVNYSWKYDACPHCQGDLFWDEEGVHGTSTGEWVCLACSRRFEIDLTPAVHLTARTVISVMTVTSAGIMRVDIRMS